MYKVLWYSVLLFLCVGTDAWASVQYSANDFHFKLSGYGTAGIIEPDFNKPDFIGDFNLRAQSDYKLDTDVLLGGVFSINAAALDEDRFFHDAFIYGQTRGVGRIELGYTASVAHKLGLGIPDVGGMRLNDESLLYKKMGTDGSVIATTTITSGCEALRLNFVSVPLNNVQYGVSFAGLTDQYDYSVDAGLKMKRSQGKIKTAWSLGASFIDSPDGLINDAYTPSVTADWRAQLATGFNLQYNSWIFGTTARFIYDENPVGDVSDGMVLGAGASYDLLNYSLSLSYLFSDTGIWDKNIKNYRDNSLVASFRYKYSEYIDCWTSMGVSRDMPFVSAALRISF